jgi:rod shape-determining protein MreD
MRWLSLLVLAIVVLTYQSALAPRLEIVGARPDLILLVSVFFAMHAPWRDAILAAWVLGAAADLMTVERFGLLSVVYALAAMIVASARDYLFRYNAFSQFVVTAFAGVVTGVLLLSYRRILYSPGVSLWADAAISVVLGPLYTAVFAPPVQGAMLMTLGWFGVAPPRYTFSGLHKLESGRV